MIERHISTFLKWFVNLNCEVKQEKKRLFSHLIRTNTPSEQRHGYLQRILRISTKTFFFHPLLPPFFFLSPCIWWDVFLKHSSEYHTYTQMKWHTVATAHKYKDLHKHNQTIPWLHQETVKVLQWPGAQGLLLNNLPGASTWQHLVLNTQTCIHTNTHADTVLKLSVHLTVRHFMYHSRLALISSRGFLCSQGRSWEML